MTALVSLAVLIWLIACVLVIALARMAARGDAPASEAPDAGFDRDARRHPSSRDPG